MILETERLVLAPLTVADAPQLYPLLSDPEVMAHWDHDALEEPAEVEACVAAQVEAMQAGQALSWAIRQAGDSAVLGSCELVDLDLRHHTAELRFMLARDRWGQAIALEAVSAVLAHAASIGLKRLNARTHVGDNRAEALLKRVGFLEEGYQKGHIHREGERRDCRLFGISL